MILLRLVTVFQEHFAPKRTIYHSRSDCFEQSGNKSKAPNVFRKKLCELEKDGKTLRWQKSVSKFITSSTDS